MTAEPEPQNEPATKLPQLSRDRSFWGMTTTQFLGAFNDNLFKQLVLLLCVDSARRGMGDRQFIAMALFAIPFVLFSGFAGFYSDRVSKRFVVVWCKIAEIAVMLLGTLAFFVGSGDLSLMLMLLFVVLFFMSTQSAFFGPAKYGILPELFREEDLPAVNGAVQMTTFVAIIFGMGLAGFTKQWFGDQIWMAGLFCIGIAMLGTLTSLFIRRTPVAHAGMRFQSSSLFINAETRHMLWSDRPLFWVLVVSSLFWFVGGVVQSTVNAFGKLQLNYGDARTSIAAACMGVGIAIGCIVAAKASHKRVNFGLVKVGSWGLVVSLAAMTVLGATIEPVEKTPEPPANQAAPSNEQTEADAGQESLIELLAPRWQGELLVRTALTALGFFAGLFVVPLQVFMQARPPKDQKGRMIGAMNLINWIGIVLSAGFYLVGIQLCETQSWPFSAIFLALALVMLPVAALYRPRMGA